MVEGFGAFVDGISDGFPGEGGLGKQLWGADGARGVELGDAEGLLGAV